MYLNLFHGVLDTPFTEVPSRSVFKFPHLEAYDLVCVRLTVSKTFIDKMTSLIYIVAMFPLRKW